MTSKVVRPRAHRDLVDIALYIGEDSPAAGERFLDAFEYTTELLLQLPTLGSLCSVSAPSLRGLRVVTVRGFRNFLILYKSLDKQLEIVRVIHGARDLGTAVDELE